MISIKCPACRSAGVVEKFEKFLQRVEGHAGAEHIEAGALISEGHLGSDHAAGCPREDGQAMPLAGLPMSFSLT